MLINFGGANRGGVMNNIIWLIMDSCRWDTYLDAHTPNINKHVGFAERRYTYDGWTYPAHLNFLLGLVPHENRPHQFASRQYKQDFKAWENRMGGVRKLFDYAQFLPEFSLVKVLRYHGYYPLGIASLPCLNKTTAVGKQFGNGYVDMPDHNDIDGIIDIILEKVTMPMKYFFEPYFFFVNIGNTHYPYMLQGQARVSGVRGALVDLVEGSIEREFDDFNFREFKQAQVDAMAYVDTVLARLFESVPSNTYFIICADHGELFGEGGFFGHGPIFHPLLFQVPYVEGLVRK